MCHDTYATMRVMTHARENAEKCHDTLPGMTGRSGRGTARQTVRVDEDLWDLFATATETLGTDRSTWIRDAIRWCVHESDVSPSRPTTPPPPIDDDAQ
jgi:hypothetical protein